MFSVGNVRLRSRKLFFIVLISAIFLYSYAEEEFERLEIRALSPEGNFEYDEGLGIARDPVGLLLTFRDVRITAKEIQFHRATAIVEARGDVRLEKGKNVWTSDYIKYNFETGEIETKEFRFGHEPIYIKGESLHSGSEPNTYIATNVILTTDNTSRPSHKIRARLLRLIPGKYIEVENATFIVNGIPIFYLPTYRYYFNKPNLMILPTPGYRSSYGPYLLTSISWEVATNLTAAVHLDYRQKRGIGTGLDLFPDLGLAGSGDFKVYYTLDDEPPRDTKGELIDKNRYRVDLRYKAHPMTNFSFRAAFRKQSDPYVTKDFFDGEYRRDREPKSFIEVSRSWPDFTLSFYTTAQINEFFQTVERLPQIKLTAYEQPIMQTPFYYRSESSAGYLRFKHADSKLYDYEALRADTYQQISYPFKIAQIVNIAPRVGIRFTHYEIEDGLDYLPRESSRWVFHTAIESSTKIWRLWPEVSSEFFEVNGLRHILEPYVTYAFIPRPSPPPKQLPQFDYLVPTFQPLPITLPEYSAIDAIDKENVFRIGMRNRLQTKREMKVDDIVDWDLFFDFYPDRSIYESHWGGLYYRLDIKPRSWVTITSEIKYDIGRGELLISDLRLTFSPNDKWSWSIAHLYLSDWAGLGKDWENNLFMSSLYYKINENWAFNITHRFEATDSRLEEQQYTLYKDMRTWTGGLTFRIREPRHGPTDYTVAVTFSIKAFPRYRLGEDAHKPELLVGG